MELLGRRKSIDREDGTTLRETVTMILCFQCCNSSFKVLQCREWDDCAPTGRSWRTGNPRRGAGSFPDAPQQLFREGFHEPLEVAERSEPSRGEASEATLDEDIEPIIPSKKVEDRRDTMIGDREQHRSLETLNRCAENVRVPTARELGVNPKSLGVNPRALGLNPRALGTNPRSLRRLFGNSCSAGPTLEPLEV